MGREDRDKVRGGAEGLGGARWGGGNGLEAAAMTPPPGLFTHGAFGNPSSSVYPFPESVTQ